MASIVLKTLSILLGVFFIFVGLIKLTPLLNSDMHKEMRKSFVQYSKVFPVPLEAFGVKLTSKWYRRSIGGIELFCGISLLLLPGILKKAANIVLLVLMLGAVYSHYAIGDRFERMAPALVFTFMLTCRLVVNWQVQRKEIKEAKRTSKKSD